MWWEVIWNYREQEDPTDAVFETWAQAIQFYDDVTTSDVAADYGRMRIRQHVPARRCPKCLARVD